MVTFKVKDFNHLSGVNSDLSDSSFFYNCLKRTITINNIKTNQHYNYQTIKDKLKRLVEINNIIYADSSTNLVLLGLNTNTYTFPLAIRNDNKNVCVAFNGNSSPFRGRSLRKGKNSLNAHNEMKINYIFSKHVKEQLYDNLVYTRNIKRLPCILVDYKTILHPTILSRFSYITDI